MDRHTAPQGPTDAAKGTLPSAPSPPGGSSDAPDTTRDTAPLNQSARTPSVGVTPSAPMTPSEIAASLLPPLNGPSLVALPSLVRPLPVAIIPTTPPMEPKLEPVPQPVPIPLADAPPSAFKETAERKRLLRVTDLLLKERIIHRIERHAAQSIEDFENAIEAAQGSVVALDSAALTSKIAESVAEYALILRSASEDARVVQGGDVEVVQQAESEERRIVGRVKSNIVEKVLEDVSKDVSKVEAKSESTRASLKARIETPTKAGVYRTFLLISAGENEGSLESTQALDPSGNIFTLAHAADSTTRHVDPRVVTDLLLCFFVAGCAAVGATVIGIPVGHGVIFSGLLLTSSTGPDAVVNLVTIESLAQIAVYVLLYAMGSEFEPQQLERVRNVALGGMPMLLMFLIFFFAAAVRITMGSPWSTGILIGIAFCVSSTQIAHRIRTRSKVPRANTLVVGMLAVEDTLLGCLSGVVPLLAAGGAFSEFLMDFSRLLGRFCIFMIIGAIITSTILPRVLRLIVSVDHGTGSVSLIAYLVAMLTLCEALGAPGEVACFSSGLMLAFAGGGQYRKFCAARISTVLDILMPFFYLIIGIRLFPQFLAAQAVVLLLISSFVIVCKFIITYALFRVFRVDHPTAAVAAITLSPLAEFSYVLVTLGRSHGLIGREVYFLSVGVITITLLVIPFLHPLVEKAVVRGRVPLSDEPGEDDGHL